MPTGDENLKAGILAGNRDDFRRLYLDLSGPLIRYANSILGDSEAAAEVVQDLFLELWEKRGSLNIRGALRPYLFASVHHNCLNQLRAARLRDLYKQNPVAVWNWTGQPDRLDTRDPLLPEILSREISLLPEQCREVFNRMVVDGKSLAETAKEVGIAAKTAENHLARARKILRKRLKNILR